MSRKIIDGSGSTDDHRCSIAPPPVARAPRRRTRPGSRRQGPTPAENDSEDRRRRTLLAIDPRLDQTVIDELRTVVVAALAATPYVSDQVDRSRASILYRYAAHMHSLHGDFDAGRHLLEEHLVDYWASGCGSLSPRSRDKALSALRTIASQRPFADGLLMRRPPTSAPYLDSRWRAFRVAADRLVDQRWAAEAHMLLDLSGEVGLRGAEINRIRGSALAWSGPTILATVEMTEPNRRRVVPIDGDAAARLAAHVGSDDHLLRPSYRNRKNAVSSLVTRLTMRDSAFAHYRAAAARHRWIARLLTSPIAHVDVVYLAGLESDSHTLHDIRSYLPPVSPVNATNSLLRARHEAATTSASGRADRPSHGTRRTRADGDTISGSERADP